MKISPTGMTLLVPVAPSVGLSRASMTPAPTGSVTEMNTTGHESPAFTQACVAGVTMGTTTS